MRPSGFLLLAAGAVALFSGGCGGGDLVPPDLAALAEARAEEIAAGTSEPTAADLFLILVAGAERAPADGATWQVDTSEASADRDRGTAESPLVATLDLGLTATSPDPAPEMGGDAPRGDGSARCPTGFYASAGRCRLAGLPRGLGGVSVSPDPAPERDD